MLYRTILPSAIAVASLLTIAACGSNSHNNTTTSTPPAVSAQDALATATPIKHLVVIFGEKIGKSLCRTECGFAVLRQLLTIELVCGTCDADGANHETVAVKDGGCHAENSRIEFSVTYAIAVASHCGEIVSEALPVGTESRFGDVAVMMLEDAN